MHILIQTLTCQAINDSVPNESYNPNLWKLMVHITITYRHFCCLFTVKNQKLYPAITHTTVMVWNVLNRFNMPLETCAVVGGLNRELMSHLTLQSNKYKCSYLDRDGRFCEYKWTNICVVEMYHFLGIIFKMLLQLSDFNRFHLLWHPPTYTNMPI